MPRVSLTIVLHGLQATVAAPALLSSGTSPVDTGGPAGNQMAAHTQLPVQLHMLQQQIHLRQSAHNNAHALQMACSGVAHKPAYPVGASVAH